MKRILLAEDELPIREGLTDLLENEGYGVDAAEDGERAVALFEKAKPDLVILDIMMPKLSGYDVCKMIRSRDAAVPVMFLSAKEEEIDKVLGLELGADDYIVKPFGVRELLARIKAALRRAEAQSSAAPDTQPFSFGPCTVDPGRFILCKDGEETELSEREVLLLRFFCGSPEKVHTRTDLLDRFWGIEYSGTTRTLDQHIAKLRQKIEDDPANPAHILTVHGSGYRFRM